MPLSAGELKDVDGIMGSSPRMLSRTTTVHKQPKIKMSARFILLGGSPRDKLDADVRASKARLERQLQTESTWNNGAIAEVAVEVNAGTRRAVRWGEETQEGFQEAVAPKLSH